MIWHIEMPRKRTVVDDFCRACGTDDSWMGPDVAVILAAYLA